MNEAPSSPRAGLRQLAAVALTLLLSAAVGLTAFGGFASHAFSVGPARVVSELKPAWGGATVVTVPPFGTIRARTHAAPLQARVTLAEVDLPALQEIALRGIPDEATQDALAREAVRGVWVAVLKGLLAALLVSAFIGWSLRHRWKMVIAAGLAGLLVPACLLGWARADFDIDAFQTPSYRGAVSYAPSLIELVQRRGQRVDSLRRQIEKLARDLTGYYAAPQSFATGGALPDAIRVLHISDLHLDPVGLKLAVELAEEFDVEFIIDTGDINHYGSPVEGAIAASQVPTGWPYIFVPGNHDSPDTVAALAALEHVRVLEETSTAIAGVRVFGVADPAAAGPGVESDPEELEGAAREIAEGLVARISEGAEETPTVIAVHNPAMVEPFLGIAELVVSGHSHTPNLERGEFTWWLDSGTTGGVHFSDTRSDPHIPHSASVLYFSREPVPRLLAIDQIEVYGITAQSSLKRSMVERVREVE